ncbi:MAG: hypothetical protein ACQEQM_05760 [Thermoplasmatota archaeon]
MIIEKKIYRLRDNQRVKSLEIKKDKQMVYYSYNYQILNGSEWKTSVRWDNYQSQPHVDSFDDNGNLLDTSSTRDKSLKEVLELIDIFGKNILNMDIKKL